jgi:hypothetical protein
VAHQVFSPTALAFLTKVSEKHKSTPPHANQVENWQKTISTEQKVDVIGQLEKGK